MPTTPPSSLHTFATKTTSPTKPARIKPKPDCRLDLPPPQTPRAERETSAECATHSNPRRDRQKPVRRRRKGSPPDRSRSFLQLSSIKRHGFADPEHVAAVASECGEENREGFGAGRKCDGRACKPYWSQKGVHQQPCPLVDAI
ncbi:uncharacterized protein LOC112175953 [Rosa chinensis]|uniref:uncharacterized protein LOC112175953 n=1 Tax=Rosa chinensis TaxID=74649 RepID=UPI001AD90D37|nr:uncharacterized protein LOC112175953 [Rosa chinensis]